MKRILSIIILLLLTAFATGDEILVESGWRYFDTFQSEKAIGSFLSGDDLRFSVGSESLNSDTVAECFNANNMTFRKWLTVNFVPGDGLNHYLLDNQGTSGSNNRIECFIDRSGRLYFRAWDKDSGYHQVTHIITDWAISSRHQIVATIDFNNDAMAIYIDGNLEDDTADVILSSDSIDAIEANTHYGSNYLAANQLNGAGTLQILDRVWSAAEVTADYASAAGSAFVVTPDTILMGRFSEDDPGIVYWHRGKAVSAISAGGTEATLTTADGAGVFSDGDSLIIYDGTGYSKQGFADGAGSGTSLDVDDGAGGAIADIEKCGVSMNCAGTHYAEGGNILNIGVEDYETDFWLKQDGDPAGNQIIIGKAATNTFPSVRWLVFISASGNIYMLADDNTNDAHFRTDITSYLDNKWHHIHIFVDRSNIATCAIRVDGESLAIITSGTFPVNTLTNASNISVGGGDGGGLIFEGSLKFAKLHIGGTMASAAQILYASTHPGDLSANSWTLDGTREAWLFDENTGTTAAAQVTSPANNLTVSNALAWDQSAFVSKIRLADFDMESGGIGGWTIVGTPTTVDKETDTDSDSQSLHVVSAADDDGVSQAISASNGDKFYLYQRHKVTAGSFEVNVTNGGGGIETVINDASWTGLEKIISATGNLTFQWLGEAAADDFNISKAEIIKCVAGDSLDAATHYTLVYNVDTTTTGAAWSGLGSDATEVKFGDLYIVNDEADASTDSKGDGFWPLDNPLNILSP